MFLLLLLLVISIFLEGTATTVPLVLVCLLCLTIAKRDWLIFPAAFFAGLFLDAFIAHQMGGSSIFFLAFVFLILLYQRKYEINSYPFVFAASFLGSLIFLGVFGYGWQIGLAFISSIIALVLFAVLKVSSNNSKVKS